eukprot:PITA_26623
MDFITGLPRKVKQHNSIMVTKQHNSIMVTVDRFSKVAHFIPVKTTYSTSEVAQVFIREIVILHGVPKTIVSDMDAKFTSKFWKDLFACLGTGLAFNTTYHPQTNDQTDRVNRILEYMLRIYVMHQKRKWEEYLPLVEFAYNNGYQDSLRMSPFEVEQEGEFQQEPQFILQWKHLMLRNRAIEQVKVQWKQFGPKEATWEMADHMWALYPSLFTS